MTDLTALIERLEKAEGPSEELDAEISVALRLTPEDLNLNADWISRNFKVWRANENGIVRAVHSDGSDGPWFKADCFTSSIDVALTLFESEEKALDSLYDAVCTATSIWQVIKRLCIAALKARGSE